MVLVMFIITTAAAYFQLYYDILNFWGYLLNSDI